MSSGERFYQLELGHRPALHGDIGSLLKIDGLVIAGSGAQAILLLPSHEPSLRSGDAQVYQLSTEEWSDFLQRSDVPEILIDPVVKAFHRKARYEISGIVQQRVYRADRFECYFCKRKMGDIQLTVDHFVPLEAGGKNDPGNYLSACRQCNKLKGATDPREFCAKKGLNYDDVVEYLKQRKI